jgi:nicotinate phosphoribosyltransferase
LAAYRFTGQISGYGEGECFFPGSPVLVVDGNFAETVILETVILSILNYDSAVAAAASRMTAHAQGRPCLEMGSRRTHEEAGVAAARAAYLAGFAATSNLEAGRRYGVPTMGTAAHAFTLLHDTERAAFAAQVASLGVGTTLLVDTFDVAGAVRTAVEVAGPGLDSGDLPELARAVRAQLDSLGAFRTRIVVSGDLDEHAIAGLAAVPVDAYGVGTQLVIGSGSPTAGMVYKLVAREDGAGQLRPVAKRSPSKQTLGGLKEAFRRLWPDGVAKAEVIAVLNSQGVVNPQTPDGEHERALLRPLIDHGEIVGAEPVPAARARHTAALAELPARARRLSRGEPALPTIVVGDEG